MVLQQERGAYGRPREFVGGCHRYPHAGPDRTRQIPPPLIDPAHRPESSARSRPSPGTRRAPSAGRLTPGEGTVPTAEALITTTRRTPSSKRLGEDLAANAISCDDRDFHLPSRAIGAPSQAAAPLISGSCSAGHVAEPCAVSAGLS
jgi:hypothetical protein